MTFTQKAVLVVSSVDINGRSMPLCHSIHLSQLDANNAVRKMREQPEWLKREVRTSVVNFTFNFH